MAGGVVHRALGMGGKMFASVSNFVIGIMVLALSGIATLVILPYVGFMAWHHNDLQTGVNKATSFVLWEARVVGAGYEGGTAVTVEGFRDGQAMTQESLGNLPDQG